MTAVRLAAGERGALVDYLDRLVGLDDRAAVRLQASGSVLGVWSGPPFGVVALRALALRDATSLDLTVSAQRLRERADDDVVTLPAAVSGPSWVGLLPPRSGWEERARAPVGQLHEAVAVAKRFFAERTDGVTDPRALERVADDVWQRACLAEVPVRAAHAAEALGLLGPADGTATAYAAGPWLRLAAPGGSVAVRRDTFQSLLTAPAPGGRTP